MVTTQPAHPDTLVHLHTAEVSVLLDLRGGRLPAVVHWGAPLGPQTLRLATNLADAAVPLIGPNTVDEAVRVSVLPEHATGFVGRPGLAGSRAGRDWSTRFLTTGLTLDGTPVDGWREDGPGALVVEATDGELGLELRLTIELLPAGLLRCRAAVRNQGAAYAVDGLTLALPVPSRATELLDFAGRWGHERVPQRAPFGVGTHLREGRKGRTGPEAATVLHAGTSGFGFGHGEVWAVHTAWSGNHVHYAELTFDGHRLLGGGELLLPGEVTLATGEIYESPWLYAAYGNGLDVVAGRFHDYLRSRPTHPATPRPVTLNVWEAVYFDHDAGRLIDLAERAAALGVERYVLDDGWFGSRRDDHRGLGDWVVSNEAWPDGLHPLVDRVNALGMEFGLWFEPEMVNEDSDVARAHPEWIMAAREDLPVRSRHQQVLDLAVPGAYDHVLDQILAILKEYRIGYLKWDHNRDLIESGDRTAGGRAAVHAQTLAIYRLLAELKERHPGLEIESCSSGGARVDLGIIDHADRVWVSDCIDPLERQAMMRWTEQLLPPELLGSHIASGRSHTTGRTHDLNFRAATAVFGHLGIEWDLADASERALAELGAWISFYKTHRGLLHSGAVVRIDEPGDGVLVHGVVAPDRAAALFAFVAVAHPLQDPAPRIVLRGLDADRCYRVVPELVGSAPSGLVAPPWWGGPACSAEANPSHPPRGPQPAVEYPGTVVTGAALMSVGLQPPRLHPDQAVLLRVDTHPESASTPQ